MTSECPPIKSLSFQFWRQMTYVLPDPSLEQTEAITLFSTNNLLIDSVAGSGKTTTILHLAHEYSDKRVLLLTYNKFLKLENRERSKILRITNIEAHSYHSFAVNYYDKRAFDDIGIHRVLDTDPKPNRLISFHLLIIDEAQDMRDDFYRLVLKIARDNIKKFANICLLGDVRQTIYRFGDADERYMLNAEQNFESIVSTTDWKTVTLHQSFRVPNEVCTFLNKCVLHEDRIWSNKSFTKPVYVVCEVFGRIPYDYLMETMQKNNYKPEDIFILAPSVKPSETSVERPTKKLQNLITKKNNLLRSQGKLDEILPIYTTEDEQFSQKDVNIMDKKIVVS
jgi:superfamily I DNA/RNA helicase